MDAFTEAMKYFDIAINKEHIKQAEYKAKLRSIDTVCHCDKPVLLVVSDEYDTYISCRVCSGEVILKEQSDNDDNEINYKRDLTHDEELAIDQYEQEKAFI